MFDDDDDEATDDEAALAAADDDEDVAGFAPLDDCCETILAHERPTGGAADVAVFVVAAAAVGIADFDVLFALVGLGFDEDEDDV